MTDAGTHVDEQFGDAEGDDGQGLYDEPTAVEGTTASPDGVDTTDVSAGKPDPSGTHSEAVNSSVPSGGAGDSDVTSVAPLPSVGGSHLSLPQSNVRSPPSEAAIPASNSTGCVTTLPPVKTEVHALPAKPMPIGEQEHLPEPPASINGTETVHSSSSTGSAPHVDLPKTPSKVHGASSASANRLSISYAGGSRRLVINSDIVEAVKIFRTDGRIEVSMTVERNGEGYKGLLVRYPHIDLIPLPNISEWNRLRPCARIRRPILPF